MTDSDEMLSSLQIEENRRSVRLLSILRCAQEAGFTPVPGPALHTIAYLADALSPVWGLPIIDAQILKQRALPNFPALQRDLDALVGRGLVRVEDLVIAKKAGDQSPIRATFSLTALAEPAITAITSSVYFGRQFEFVREVTFAAAAFGPDALGDIGSVDASYGDPFADFGSVIDLGEMPTHGQTTAQVARRFREIAPDAGFNDAQLVHLYLRHLYSRLHVA